MQAEYVIKIKDKLQFYLQKKQFCWMFFLLQNQHMKKKKKQKGISEIYTQ